MRDNLKQEEQCETWSGREQIGRRTHSNKLNISRISSTLVSSRSSKRSGRGGGGTSMGSTGCSSGYPGAGGGCCDELEDMARGGSPNGRDAGGLQVRFRWTACQGLEPSGGSAVAGKDGGRRYQTTEDRGEGGEAVEWQGRPNRVDSCCSERMKKEPFPHLPVVGSPETQFGF